MTQQKMFHLISILVLVPLVIVLSGCGAPATPAPIEPAPQPPSVIQPTIAPGTPSIPQPPNVVVSLPPSAVTQLNDIASKKGWGFSLATQHTVFYAFPDNGIAFLLTPAEKGPESTAAQLAEDAKTNKIDSAKVFGSLTVIQQLHNELPQGDYLMTLAPDGNTVQFTTFTQAEKEVRAEFSAVIRSLPLALPRPVALITSSQMCVAWETTQICALVPTPLRSDLADQLTQAIKDTGADPSNFSLERAIPDVEGFDMIATCASELSKEPPAYANCQATILAAPAVADGAFANPSETKGTTIGIGVLLVLKEIKDQIFLDPELTLPTPSLPGGPYLTYEVLLGDENPAPGKPIATRVRDSGPSGDFYLPAVSGGVVIGDPVLGSGPSNADETIILNLWNRGRCTGWKWWQCPWIK